MLINPPLMVMSTPARKPLALFSNSKLISLPPPVKMIERAAADRELGLRLDSVHASVEVERAAFDQHIAFRGVFVVVRLQTVAERVDGDRPIFDGEIIPAANAVINRVDRNHAARDFQIILAGDAVVEIRSHGQRAAAVDGQVVLAENRRIGFFRLCVIVGICHAIGDVVLCAIRQGDDGLICTADINRRAG